MYLYSIFYRVQKGITRIEHYFRSISSNTGDENVLSTVYQYLILDNSVSEQ